MDVVDHKRLPQLIVMLGGVLTVAWAGCLGWFALTGVLALLALAWP